MESWNLKQQNLKQLCRETPGEKARVQLIPFRDTRWKERVFQKTMAYSEDGNVVYSPCSMWCVSYWN